MPQPVRVAPRGELQAVSAKGALMGNRGHLHDLSGTVVRDVTSYSSWVCCLLSFKGGRRRLRAPNRYTELFFLDEATALSAGHRPCGTCRRRDLRRFCDALSRGADAPERLRPSDIDKMLDRERRPVGPDRPVLRALLVTLPAGTIVETADKTTAHLWWQGRLRAWRPDGYATPLADPPAEVGVITPPTMVAALRGGYVPEVHPTAAG
jgi:hypothetical protein